MKGSKLLQRKARYTTEAFYGERCNKNKKQKNKKDTNIKREFISVKNGPLWVKHFPTNYNKIQN